MSKIESGRKIQSRGLFLNGFNNCVTAVAGITAPKAGGGIQQRAPVCVVAVHVFGGDNQARALTKTFNIRERLPKGVCVYCFYSVIHDFLLFQYNGDAKALTAPAFSE